MIRAITNNAVVVTASDDADLVSPGAILVQNGGALTVDTLAGDTVEFENVPDGYELKCIVKKVHATGLTASGIILYYDK
jgi:hypothetical protein